jgi:hypothetical protein
MKTPRTDEDIASFFRRLRVGAPLPCGSVAVVPLLEAGGTLNADADLLEEALLCKQTTVTEVSEAGAVDRVLVRHGGTRPLLLLHGEEVVGAKQNRIFNASFVIAPGTTAEVPVSCVESGRWGYTSPGGFTTSSRTVTSSMRGSCAHRVTSSLARRGTYDANQGQVWSDVDQHLRRRRITSRTAAYADAADSQLAEVTALLDRLVPGPDWTGAAFLMGGRLMSLDVFGSAALFARALPKVVAGVVAELPETPESQQADAGLVERLVASIVTREFVRRPAAGGCETMHAEGDPAVAAVAAGGFIYHLFAAPALAAENPCLP